MNTKEMTTEHLLATKEQIRDFAALAPLGLPPSEEEFLASCEAELKRREEFLASCEAELIHILMFTAVL